MKTIRVLATCTLIILAWSWLAGCRSANVPDRAAGTDLTGPYVPVVVRPDTTARLDSMVVTPHRSLVDKVLGRQPKSEILSTPARIGKKSTVAIYYGPATVTTTTVGKKATAATGAGATATTIEKAKAPVTTGTGDATDQRGTGAASTIKGNNNAPVLTNAPVEAPDWKAQLAAGFATPVGKVLAVLLLAGAGYGVYRLWPLLRRKSSDTQS